MTPHPWCRLLLTSILGMFLAQGWVASAQNPDPVEKPQIIEAIRFEGVKGLDEEELRSNLGLKVKGSYDEEVQFADEIIIKRSLWEQGYVYADIHEVRTQLGAAGRIIVVFVIEPGDIYRVSEVKLTGNKAFKSTEIAPTTQATAGKLYSHSSIKEDEEMILYFYGSRGYVDATVDIHLLEVGKGSMKVTYEITEGQKYLLQAIQISGNVKVKEEAIRKRFKLASGDAIDCFLVEQGRQELLKTGRFESVQVSTPAAKPGYKNIEVIVGEK